jgi:hypothetical protein
VAGQPDRGQVLDRCPGQHGGRSRGPWGRSLGGKSNAFTTLKAEA